MRCTEIEAHVREQVANEMAEQMQNIEMMFQEMLAKENDMNEEKTEKKLDMLSRQVAKSPPEKCRDCASSDRLVVAVSSSTILFFCC